MTNTHKVIFSPVVTGFGRVRYTTVMKGFGAGPRYTPVMKGFGLGGPSLFDTASTSPSSFDTSSSGQPWWQVAIPWIGSTIQSFSPHPQTPYVQYPYAYGQSAPINWGSILPIAIIGLVAVFALKAVTQ